MLKVKNKARINTIVLGVQLAFSFLPSPGPQGNGVTPHLLMKSRQSLTAMPVRQPNPENLSLFPGNSISEIG